MLSAMLMYSGIEPVIIGEINNKTMLKYLNEDNLKIHHHILHTLNLVFFLNTLSKPKERPILCVIRVATEI